MHTYTLINFFEVERKLLDQYVFLEGTQTPGTQKLSDYRWRPVAV